MSSEKIYIKGVRVLNSDAFESVESNSINILLFGVLMGHLGGAILSV